MIRCNHCGKLAPTGATSCQGCGMPLVSAGGTGGQSQQQDLPAWLESLRAHDRPVATSGMGDHQPFSMAELVDENAMPSWMRLDQAKLSESSEYPALPPRTKPEAGPERQTLAATGFEASSLIDEKSLPSWMRGQEGGHPAADQSLSANSLVQPESVPQWMRNLDSGQHASAQGIPTSSQMQPDSTPPWMGNLDSGQHASAQGIPSTSQMQSDSTPPWMRNLDSGQYASTQGIPSTSQMQSDSTPPWMRNLDSGPSQAPSWQADVQYGLPTQAQVPSSPTMGAGNMPQTPISTPDPSNYNGMAQIPNQGFSAGDLIDQQSLPNWMTNPQGQQNPSLSVPTGHGFSAGELVDQQSLPMWMKSQQPQANSGPIPTMGTPMNGSGQGAGMGQELSGGMGMPAANLLDVNALPSWMREGEQSANEGYAQGTQQPNGTGMVAGSLIDINAVPAWMRNADNAQNIQPSGGIRSAQPQPQPRVPGRPRGEAGSQEHSEAAANVFASMLGVSASAPNLPGQPTNLGVPQGTPIPQAKQPSQTNLGVPQASPVPYAQQQSVMPGWQSPQQPAMNQGPSGWQMPGPGAPSSPGTPSFPSAFYQQPGGMGVPQTPQQQPTYMGVGEPNRAGPGPAAGTSGNSGMGMQTESPKKKSFFEAIRDFFFK